MRSPRPGRRRATTAAARKGERAAPRLLGCCPLGLALGGMLLAGAAQPLFGGWAAASFLRGLENSPWRDLAITMPLWRCRSSLRSDLPTFPPFPPLSGHAGKPAPGGTPAEDRFRTPSTA